LIIVSSSLSMGIRDVGLGLILLSVLKTTRGEERFPAPLAAARFRQAGVRLRKGIGDRRGLSGLSDKLEHKGSFFPFAQEREGPTPPVGQAPLKSHTHIPRCTLGRRYMFFRAPYGGPPRVTRVTDLSS
jgi:hypothetical protein